MEGERRPGKYQLHTVALYSIGSLQFCQLVKNCNKKLIASKIVVLQAFIINSCRKLKAGTVHVGSYNNLLMVHVFFK